MTNGRVFASLLIFVLVAFGCGARNVYDSLRIYQEINCEKLIGTDREECLRRSGMSYDEYQKHLNEKQDTPKN
mgnify:CR=1 FL=1